MPNQPHRDDPAGLSIRPLMIHNDRHTKNRSSDDFCSNPSKKTAGA
jgi:hypothetical protein